MPTKVTSKGQITLPKWVRDALQLHVGSQIEFVLEGNQVKMLPHPASVTDRTAGIFKAYAKKRTAASEKAMMERVRQEVARAAASEGLPRRHKRSS